MKNESARLDLPKKTHPSLRRENHQAELCGRGSPQLLAPRRLPSSAAPRGCLASRGLPPQGGDPAPPPHAAGQTAYRPRSAPPRFSCAPRPSAGACSWPNSSPGQGM